MGLFDDAVPGGNIAKPLMIAVGALLLGKLFGGSKSSAPAPQPHPSENEDQGGSEGGGFGGLLSALSGAGLGAAVESWLGSGANKPVEPGQLKSALGSQVLSELAQKSGMSEQELVEQLAQALPAIIDKMTPDGKVPDAGKIASMLRS